MGMDFKSRGWGKNGKWAAQRLHGGRVKAKLGRRMKVRVPPHLVQAMCAMMRCTSSGCMGRDLSFPAGLGGKGGTKLSHGPGHVPGNA